MNSNIEYKDNEDHTLLTKVFKMEYNLPDLECFSTKEAAEKWLLKTPSL